MQDQSVSDNLQCDEGAGRRQFLKKAGMFAVATPPSITLLLSSGGTSPAWASGHGNASSHGNNGYGNGGGDGVPGRSGKSDGNR
jgi:hypothetical protein